MQRPFRAAIFDLDDTLNDRPLCWQKFIPVFQEAYGSRLAHCDSAQINELVLNADESGYRVKTEFFRDLSEKLPWIDPPTPAELEKFWRSCFASCMVERNGARQLLVDLHTQGLKIAIISNGLTDMQNAKIATLGFDSFAHAIFISETVGIKKPDPRIFQMALKSLACEPHRAIFIGDHPTIDIVGAKQAGLYTAWLKLNRPWPEKDHQPDFVIDELADLRAILEIIPCGEKTPEP